MAEGGRSVAKRVAAILMTFRNGDNHSLTELAALTGLPLSTTHRLVGELAGQRLLERTEAGSYRIGLPLRMMGPPVPHQAPPLQERGLAVLADLAEVTRSRVRMGMFREGRLVVADAEPGRAPRGEFTVDPEAPHGSALGRALLAFGPAADVDRVLAHVRIAGRPSLRPDRLRKILAATRLARVAVQHDASGSTRALAVPVFGTGGVLLAALEGAVTDAPAGSQTTRMALLVAAASLSRDLATARHAEAGTDDGPGPDDPEEPDSAVG